MFFNPDGPLPQCAVRPDTSHYTEAPDFTDLATTLALLAGPRLPELAHAIVDNLAGPLAQSALELATSYLSPSPTVHPHDIEVVVTPKTSTPDIVSIPEDCPEYNKKQSYNEACHQ